MTSARAMPGTASLSVTRRFAAPPALVYAAWTEPERMARWFGPRRTEVVRAESDPRVGRGFRVLMRENGGEDHDVSGVFREVVPNERLVFTWAWRRTPDRESLVTVTFARDGDGTLLTLMHERLFDEAVRDDHRGGWAEALDRLGEVFA
jgi:uncharacterized protein YndB with AHSA1/START domain